ncbi:MAG TPA: flagellar hook-associated protein FlgK [Planctomycetaceae bacterium]|nr:flagellar hook-associated protein FlgK [Planctomycetaceae bacterium]
MGLNAALSTAGSALDIFSSGIQVAGNNIANANDPNYVRESLLLDPSFPVQQGGLIIGSGVTATGVKQQIDQFLQTRIYAANGDASGSSARNSTYQQLETSLQTLSGADLSSQLSQLTGQFNNLVNQPELGASRQLAVQQGVQFAQSVTDLRSRIDTLRTTANSQVDSLVTEANSLIDDIAALNPRITALESAGLLKSDAGGLRDQRYADLNRLSQIVPITVIDHGTGGVDVALGNDSLIIPGAVHHLETSVSGDRGIGVENVTVEGTNTPISGSKGELAGTIFGRDNIAGGFIDKLDQFTSSIINQFNLIHSSGQGEHGYTSVTGTYRVKDPNAALDAAGLAFPPQNGSFQVEVVNTSTGIAQTSTINVDLAGVNPRTTLNGVVSQLNGVANLSASVTSDGFLQINAANGYQVEFANDNSGTLAALGVNTFFTGSSSVDIGVNSQLTADPTLLAAGQGGGPGDGSNAALLAGIGNLSSAALGGSTIGNFYQQTVSALGQASSSENAVSQGFQGFLDALNSQKAQFSGISIDNEMIQIMQFQNSYQTAARFISTIDKLFTSLLQI